MYSTETALLKIVKVMIFWTQIFDACLKPRQVGDKRQKQTIRAKRKVLALLIMLMVSLLSVLMSETQLIVAEKLFICCYQWPW